MNWNKRYAREQCARCQELDDNADRLMENVKRGMMTGDDFRQCALENFKFYIMPHLVDDHKIDSSLQYRLERLGPIHEQEDECGVFSKRDRDLRSQAAQDSSQEQDSVFPFPASEMKIIRNNDDWVKHIIEQKDTHLSIHPSEILRKAK
jgi:hypothetical protein